MASWSYPKCQRSSARKIGPKVKTGMNKQPDLRFRPGPGLPPPVLAGRGTEKARIRSVLDDLRPGQRTTTNIALIGPRGNGKTVLLKWVKEQVGHYNGEIECVELRPECFESHHSLATALSGPGATSALSADGFSASINLFGIKFGLMRQRPAEKSLMQVLEKRCSKNGLAILIDEAHTLDHHPDVARSLFYNTQMLAGDGHPLLLILAGTPNITKRLALIEATFWSRIKKFGIGLLDEAAAREAIRIPFERMGYSVKADIVDEAAREAQCYPYFLQVVGDALHWVARKESGKLGSGNEIGNEILAQALEELNGNKKNYYEERYLELFDAGILPAAEAVARRFILQNGKSISAAAFEVAVSRSVDKKMEELAKRSGLIEPAAWVGAELRDFGFVWSQIGREDSCEAGIPSLMNYVAERADARENELGRTRESARSAPHPDESGYDDASPD